MDYHLQFPLHWTEGHADSQILSIKGGSGSLCLTCFTSVIVDHRALLTQKIFAVTFLTQAIENDLHFASTLLNYRSVLVRPIIEALAKGENEELSTEICSICESLSRRSSPFLDLLLFSVSCEVDGERDGRASGPSLLHLLGKLVDLYCKQSGTLPERLKAPSCLSQIVGRLQHPRDDVQAEALFVLFKVASAPDGVDLLQQLPHVVQAMLHLTLTIASETTVDDLRINSLALLNSLARCGLLGLTSFEKAGGSSPHQNGLEIKLLTEAMKASLLSTDLHAQLLACQLTTVLASDPTLVMTTDIARLVEADVDMFVYEVLRASRPGAQAVSNDAMLASAVQALNALSRAGDPFHKHFVFGFEAVVHALATAVEASFAALQADVCTLLSTALQTNPGSLPAASTEQLISALASVLEQHLDGVQATASHQEPLAVACFVCACSALASVLKWRPALLSSKAEEALTVALVVLNAVEGRNEAGEYIRAAADLVASVCLSFLASGEGRAHFAASLINLCDVHLVPAYMSGQDEPQSPSLHVAVHEALSAALRLPIEGAQVLAQKLAATMWIRLDFELLASTPSEPFQAAVFSFLAVLVGHVSGAEAGDLVSRAVGHLPRHAQGMLVMLESSSGGSRDEIALHEAVLALLYSAAVYRENRIVDDVQLLASIERLLLTAAWQTSPDVSDATIKHLLFLYSTTREASTAQGVRCNARAERALVDLLGARGALPAAAHELPFSVIAWLFQQERLRAFNEAQMESWLVGGPIREGHVAEERGGFLRVAEQVLLGTAEAPLLVASIVERLTAGCMFERSEQIFRGLKEVAEVSEGVGTALVQAGLGEEIRKLLLLHVRDLPAPALIATLDLLGALLPGLTALSATEAGNWGHIAQQSCALLLHKTRQAASPASTSFLLAALNLLNRIIFHGLLGTPALREPAAALLSDPDLTHFCENVIRDSARAQQAARALSNARDRVLLAALTFHHLWLHGTPGTRPSVHPVSSGPSTLDPFPSGAEEGAESAVSCGDLLQILQAGPNAAGPIASSCLLELISHLATPVKTLESQQGAPQLSPTRIGAAVSISRPQLRVLVLFCHNLLSSGDIFLRRNGFRCLAVLCQAERLGPEMRRLASHSPWNRFLLQQFVASFFAVESAETNAACLGGSTPMLALEAAPLMTSFLRLAPRPSWVTSAFTPQACSRIVDLVCTNKRLCPDLVEFLGGLRKEGFLEADDVCKLEAFFQRVQTSFSDASATACCELPLARSESRDFCQRVVKDVFTVTAMPRKLDTEESSGTLIHASGRGPSGLDVHVSDLLRQVEAFLANAGF